MIRVDDLNHRLNYSLLILEIHSRSLFQEFLAIDTDLLQVVKYVNTMTGIWGSQVESIKDNYLKHLP